MKTKGLQKVKKVILSGGILLTGLLTFGFSEKLQLMDMLNHQRVVLIYVSKGNVNCAPIQYEPQSVEGIGGFPQLGPSDGQIAGAGHFPALDVQTVDRWKKVTLNGGANTFKWKLTAPHSTKEWKYYITKKIGIQINL